MVNQQHQSNRKSTWDTLDKYFEYMLQKLLKAFSKWKQMTDTWKTGNPGWLWKDILTVRLYSPLYYRIFSLTGQHGYCRSDTKFFYKAGKYFFHYRQKAGWSDTFQFRKTTATMWRIEAMEILAKRVKKESPTHTPTTIHNQRTHPDSMAFGQPFLSATITLHALIISQSSFFHFSDCVKGESR